MSPRKKTASSKTSATPKSTPKPAPKSTPKMSTGKARQSKKVPTSAEFVESEIEDGFIVDDFDEHDASEYNE
jgi:hypothetical protein